jgi:hypothetical protein
MERIQLLLARADHEDLNARFPATSKSSNVGDRAIELAKIYFRSLDSACTFREQVNDCDLEITFSGGETKHIEVKGTASLDLAWSKLKVSGTPSYLALIAGMPLFRVTRVYEQTPVIFVMAYPDDFQMEPEPRWRVKQVRSNNSFKPTPLRGAA